MNAGFLVQTLQFDFGFISESDGMNLNIEDILTKKITLLDFFRKHFDSQYVVFIHEHEESKFFISLISLTFLN